MTYITIAIFITVLLALWKVDQVDRRFVKMLNHMQDTERQRDLYNVFVPIDVILNLNQRFEDRTWNWYTASILRAYCGQQTYEEYLEILRDIAAVKKADRFVMGMVLHNKYQALEAFLIHHYPGDDRFLQDLPDLKYSTNGSEEE